MTDRQILTVNERLLLAKSGHAADPDFCCFLSCPRHADFTPARQENQWTARLLSANSGRTDLGRMSKPGRNIEATAVDRARFLRPLHILTKRRTDTWPDQGPDTGSFLAL